MTYTLTWEADGSRDPEDFPDTEGPSTSTIALDTVPLQDVELAQIFTCTMHVSDGQDHSVASVSQSIPPLDAHGSETPFPDTNGHAPDFLVGLAITVDSSVTVSHLAVIINTGQGNKGRLALYADEENRPGALLVGTEYQALNKGRNFFPVNDITIPAGTYWIVAHYDDFVGVSAYTDGESYTQFGRMTADGEFPDPIPNLKGYPGWQMNYDLLGY